MNMTCIAIDDEPYALKQISKMITITDGLTLLESFENPFDALKFLHEQGSVDIVFCDIGMPFINGIEAGKLLNTYCEFLIYVTAHRDYGAEVSELNAFGYLLKPVKTAKFLEKVDSVMRQKNAQFTKNHPDHLTFIKGSLKNNYIAVKVDDIVFIKAQLNYIEIHTTSKTYLNYQQLYQVEKHIKNRTEFIKINRSVIISMHHFDRVDGYTVYLKTKDQFIIGRSERDKFFDYLKKRLFNPL